MASAEDEVKGQLDGRDPNAPNYPPLSWRGVSLYHEVELGQNTVVRPAGADPGKLPGDLWWTTSTLDQITVLSEIYTNKYHGQTGWDMLCGLFAVLVEGKDPAEVRKSLGM